MRGIFGQSQVFSERGNSCWWIYKYACPFRWLSGKKKKKTQLEDRIIKKSKLSLLYYYGSDFSAMMYEEHVQSQHIGYRRWLLACLKFGESGRSGMSWYGQGQQQRNLKYQLRYRIFSLLYLSDEELMAFSAGKQCCGFINGVKDSDIITGIDAQHLTLLCCWCFLHKTTLLPNYADHRRNVLGDT